MATPRKILFPTDFSETSTAALPYATHLAAALGAELHLLNVTVLHDLQPASAPGFPSAERLQEALASEAGRLLAQLPTGGGDLRVVRAQSRAVSAAPAILDYIDGQSIELVVMATHGRRGFRRLVAGSVTEEVVRQARCPVLALRGAAPVSAAAAENLLAPVDLGPQSEHVIRWAQHFSVLAGAHLDLLHVVEAAQPALVYDTFGVDLTVDIEGLLAESRTGLEELRDRCGLDPATTGVHVVEGPAWRVILEWAATKSVDLIVLGPGAHGVDRLLLGSTVERVLRQASCPLLVVRGDAAS
jgi:nucleotide-binding universal stress UspA family protein